MPRHLAILTLSLLLLPCALQGASRQESEEISRFWTSDALHTIQIHITSQQWQMMQPVRKGSLQHISASAMQPPPSNPSTRPVLPAPAAAAPLAAHAEGERLEPNFYGYEFAYVKADFECDGIALRDVGFRLRGNSSFGWGQSGLKRPYKIDFNHFQDAQKFQGMGRLYLNNNAYDPSLMRETLAYEVFRKLNVPAPRTTYALLYLTIDGRCEREYVGLYTLIEPMDTKPFLKNHFASAKGMLMKPWSIRGLPYLGETWEKYDRYYNPRSDPTPSGVRRTIDFIKLVNYADDETFRRHIAEYLDVDEYLRLLAGDVLLANLDTFLFTGHNFYLYLNPKDDRFAMMPWDMNLSFANYTSAGSIAQQVHLSIMRPHSGEARIIDRLLAMPQYADLYRSHIRRAIETFFNPQAMSARFDVLQAVLAKADAAADAAWRERFAKGRPALATQPSKIPPRPVQRLMGWQGEPAIDLRTFVAQRVESLNAQLAGQTDGYTPGYRRYPQPPPGGLRAHSSYGYLPMLAYAILRGNDTDYDNKLSLSEGQAAVRAFFNEADASHRGWLDEPTLAQALARKLKAVPAPRRDRGGSSQPQRQADPQAWARALVKAVDPQETGRITLPQALAAIDQAFTRRAAAGKAAQLDADSLLSLLDSLAVAAPPPRQPEPPRQSAAIRNPATTQKASPGK